MSISPALGSLGSEAGLKKIGSNGDHKSTTILKCVDIALKPSYHFGIWHASWQQYCQDASQISEWLKILFLNFITLRFTKILQCQFIYQWNFTTSYCEQRSWKRGRTILIIDTIHPSSNIIYKINFHKWIKMMIISYDEYLFQKCTHFFSFFLLSFFWMTYGHVFPGFCFFNISNTMSVLTWKVWK